MIIYLEMSIDCGISNISVIKYDDLSNYSWMGDLYKGRSHKFNDVLNVYMHLVDTDIVEISNKTLLKFIRKEKIKRILNGK